MKMETNASGKIIKGIGGFYYVYVKSDDPEVCGVYECRARGIFRKDGVKPLVGDDVRIDIISVEEKTGNVEEILPRKNSLIRPAVANVDQAVVIFAAAKPAPNLNLLDRFLLMMEKQNIPVVICFNKIDLVDGETAEHLKEIYKGSGCEVLLTSMETEEGLESLRNVLAGKTSTVAGPSGVGKSSITNALGGDLTMETGAVSEKIDRGKHTTRHSQLLVIGKDTYLMDTPGFSSLYVEKMEKEELKDYIPEFYPYEGNCRFLPCTHTHEPDCAVKAALAEGLISKERYDSYLVMYEELKERRRY